MVESFVESVTKRRVRRRETVILAGVLTGNVVCVLKSDNSWRKSQLWHIP